MYLDKAITRINNIQWNLVGTTCSKSDGDLGYEFLRRLAKFFKEEAITPFPPLFSNIAKLLGDDEEVDISYYCNFETTKFLDKDLYIKKPVQHYIQLARLNDKNTKSVEYLCVYEPLIRILERGGSFTLRYHWLEVEKAGDFPLSGWYERFIDKKPIDVSDL